jgi:hypothetical protein
MTSVRELNCNTVYVSGDRSLLPGFACSLQVQSCQPPDNFLNSFRFSLRNPSRGCVLAFSVDNLEKNIIDITEMLYNRASEAQSLFVLFNFLS